MQDELLFVKDLWVDIIRGEEKLNVLSGINLHVKRDEAICIVGESGCGKTILGLSLLRLLPINFSIKGEIYFKGKNLLKLDEKKLEKIRGKEISMVFQDPMTSLNPLFKIGDQIKEVLDVHNLYDPGQRIHRVFELLNEVGLPASRDFYNRYPHQLSGGQKQRVMIAMAVACNPSLLIADEPTTALDVTIQAQILNLFKKIKEIHRTSLIYITHDLHIVKHIATRILIMYLGTVVEEAPLERLFESPLHPYTKGLFEAIPSVHKRNKPLKSIPGAVPSLDKKPKGCVFHPRCSKAKKSCLVENPNIKMIEKNHFVRCFLYGA